jgi:hypothetical protein
LAENDPNIAVEDLNAVDDAVVGHDTGKENNLLAALVEDSPYPEVGSPPSLIFHLSFH